MPEMTIRKFKEIWDALSPESKARISQGKSNMFDRLLGSSMMVEIILTIIDQQLTIDDLTAKCAALRKTLIESEIQGINLEHIL